jgi:superfamily I DNA/RNA helicase
MKGGEADNIIVVPDLSYAAYREYNRNPSTEHRVFYVAVTRAKESLHILYPQTNRAYDI